MSTKSRVYLDPMAPDGTPGGVKEIVYHEAPQMYAEPVPYASNDAALDVARKKVAAAATELRHAEARHAPALEIQRLESSLASLKQELAALEQPRRDQRTRETGDGVTPSRQSLGELVASTVAGVARVVGIQQAKDTTTAAERSERGKRIWARVVNLVGKNNAPACCSGRYLCPTCEAKKAAA